MKSLILTTLYLAKDTVHRWLTRISSPLARVLVVYFLSLCALAALGSYVITTQVIRDRITEQGGDLVAVTASGSGNNPVQFPSEKEISDLLDADSFAFHALGYAQGDSRLSVPVITYDFCRIGQFFPLLAPSGRATYLVPDTPDSPPAGPATLIFNKEPYDVYVRHLPENHLLMRFMEKGCIVVQPDNIPPELERARGGGNQIIMRIRHLESSHSIRVVEDYFRRYTRLENMHGSIMSAARLLGEMDNILSKQTQCRIAFCIGISSIVGILLTALAGMEYRQNEYIYTLMKSFGIHPAMLVGAFVVENCVIVGASFAGALATFMHFQKPIVKEILKLGDYSLTLQDIMPEIHLISYTLAACILFSCLPIIVAANRAIGRVLK